MKTLIVCLLGLSSLSMALTLTNAGFETPALGDGGWTAEGSVDDWIAGGSASVQDMTTSSLDPAAQEGENTSGLNGKKSDSDNGGYIFQTIKYDDGSVVLVEADKTYKIQVWIGRRSDTPGSVAGILEVSLQESASLTLLDTATYDLTAQSQGTWVQQTFYLTTGSSPVGQGTSELQVRFQNPANRADYANWYYQQVVLDEVVVTDPYIAENVSPTDGATLVPVTTSLNWSAPEGFVPTGYNVRIGKDPNMTTILETGTTETTTDSDPTGDLDYSRLYYWRVDAIDPNDGSPVVRIGDIWSFTTIPDAPAITGQPVSQTASVDSNVEFSVTALNATNYAWYKSADAVISDDTPVGTDSSTLSLSLVQVSDEAYYYCIATGPNGSATSDMATLGIERQIAHWALDGLVGGQYADSSGEGHPADPNGVPVFVSGAINNGVTIDTANGWASVGIWDPSEFTGQLTISMWVKTTGDFGDWRGLIAKRNAWSSDDMMWRLEQDNGSGNVVFGSTSGSIASDTALPANEWEHVAVTFDGTTAMIYRDGVLDVSGSVSFDNGSDANLMIGVGEKNDDGVISSIFDGDLDDIQIYNYALSYTDIADIYIAAPITDSYVCTESYASVYDTDGDCVISLDDFADFAAKWLDCGRYPQTECN